MPSFMQNYIAYRASRLSSRHYCIAELVSYDKTCMTGNVCSNPNIAQLKVPEKKRYLNFLIVPCIFDHWKRIKLTNRSIFFPNWHYNTFLILQYYQHYAGLSITLNQVKGLHGIYPDRQLQKHVTSHLIRMKDKTAYVKCVEIFYNTRDHKFNE